MTEPVSITWLRALARYNRWMNDKLYAATAELPDEARRRDVGAFFGSVHGTLNHLLLADRVWLARVHGIASPVDHLAPGISSLDQELYASFDELRRERARTDGELTRWVGGLTCARLASTFVYERAGKRVEAPLWTAAAHLFNHQTHHRGQVTALLLQLGVDPGVTDLIAMLRAETR